MRTHETSLEGLVLIEPIVRRDDRGFFLETFRHAAYRAIGISATFVQDNQSRSRRGTVRGLHFQKHPGQSKLVRVARGAVWDVVVDIRPSSPTFRQWESFELDDERNLQLYVPVGFAHGFCALTDPADVVYKVSSYFDPDLERGITWDDPDIGIVWPTEATNLSPRDMSNPRLEDILADLE